MSEGRVRLGIGETVPSGPNFFAQRRFLEAVERRVPEVLRQLKEIAELPPNGRSRVTGWLDDSTENALNDWAERWGFPHPSGWWMRQVRRHIRSWRETPSLSGRWQVFVGAYREPPWPTLQWNPNEETERGFRDRVNAAISRTRDAKGIQPAPTSYEERDFDAVVLEHVAGLTIREICDVLNLPDDDSTVRNHNSELAEILGLTLRRRARGRPPSKTGKQKSV